MSTPANPEGTRPNAVRAEYRPPTVGSALKILYPSALAATSIGEPGSVTITMRSDFSMPAAVKACSKMRFCESVSTVDPDFDETIIAVCSMS